MTSAGKNVSHDGLITTVCDDDLGLGCHDFKCPAVAVFDD